MAEHIEREATIKRIEEVYCADCNSYNGVRCRYCTYWGKNTDENGYCHEGG